MSKFGDKILTLRVKYGLSRKQLGDLLGVSQSAIQATENGWNTPQLRIRRCMVLNLKKLAAHLPEDVSELEAALYE